MLLAVMSDQQQLLLCLAGLALGYLLGHFYPLPALKGRAVGSGQAAPGVHVLSAREDMALVAEVKRAAEKIKDQRLKAQVDAFVNGLAQAQESPPAAAPPAAAK